MIDFHTKNAQFSLRQLPRRDRAVGVSTSVFALLSVAACGGNAGGVGFGSPTPPAVTPSETIVSDSGIIPFADATVSGNDTTIDLSGFPTGSTLSTEFGFIGEDGKLTLSDDVFTDGTHTLTITGFDAAGDALDPQTIVLVSDKTPTIATGLADEIAVDASTAPVIDLAGVFGGGSGELTITASFDDSFGTIGKDNKLSISDGALTDPTHTLTFTATDSDGDAVEETVELVTDKTLVVANALQNATVAGNGTIIDLSTVFANDGEAFTLAASFGELENNMLTLSDAVFTEGSHTITITATAESGEVAVQIFVLVSDKTPTINTTIADSIADTAIVGNDGTTIDVSGVFGHGSGSLTLDASAGTIDTAGVLDLAGSDLNDGPNTIILTATDTDGDTVTLDIVVDANKSPTVNTGAEIAVDPIEGNDGTMIDIGGVFGNGDGDLTLTASFGSASVTVTDGKITLLGDDLVNGDNTITITATDSDDPTPQTVTSTFVINADKFPTINPNTLASEIAVTGETDIDLAGVFGGGSGELTITASLGASTFAVGADKKLALSALGLTDATHSITFTATDEDGDAIKVTVGLVSDRNIVVNKVLANETVAGNAATIDLSEAFSNAVETFVLTAELAGSPVALGTGGDDLTLSDSVFTEGIHTLTITATATGGEVAMQTFELVSDKTPTINTAVANAIADPKVEGNGDTSINLDMVFANGSGKVTLDTSAGTIDPTTNMLNLLGSDLSDGTNTIILTATDANGDTVTLDIMVDANKSPTVTTGAEIDDESILGNGGTVIDIGGVFDNAGGTLILSASLDGTSVAVTDNKINFTGADLDDGMNTITITATDSDDPTPQTVTSTFVITTNKSPTVHTGAEIADDAVTGNGGTLVDIGGVFGGGSRGSDGSVALTLSASVDGTSIAVTDGKIDLTGADLVDGENTIIITAADSDATPQTVTDTFVIDVNKSPTVHMDAGIADETLPGNGGKEIDLNTVFGNGGGALTFAASLGTINTNGTLVLTGADLADGDNTINVTASDSDDPTPQTVTDTFVITTNKSPTVTAATIADETLPGNGGTLIDVSGVFGGGSRGTDGTVPLTLSASLGGVTVAVTDGKIDLTGADLADGDNTFTITAADSDATPQTVTDTFVLTVDKSPTIVGTGLADEILVNKGVAKEIDLAGVFGGGSRGSDGSDPLTYVVSFDGSFGNYATFGSDNKITISIDATEAATTFTATVTASDSNNDTVKEVVKFVTDKNLVVANPVPDATVAGNDTVVDLSTVFETGGTEVITITAKLGDSTIAVDTNKMLTLDDSVFTEGIHTITITATAGSKSVEDVFVLVSDKTPTIATSLVDLTVAGNGGTIIDLSSAFDGGSGARTLTASLGGAPVTVGGGSLTISDGADLDDGANTITVTATDSDTTAPDSVTSIFVITTNKSPTVTTATIADDTIAGNGGTVIDVSGVFGGGSGDLTLTASLGGTSVAVDTAGKINLTGADLVNGDNTFIITASDTDAVPQTVTQTFVITVDKAPTVKTAINDTTITDNGGATIDVGSVFGHPIAGETLDISTTFGTITTGSLTIMEADLPQGIYTITLMATDNDATNKDSITSTFVLTSDKSPTITSIIGDETLAKGNSGTIIDVGSVFGHPVVGETLSLSASTGTIGLDNSLTLDGDDLDEGMNTITLTAIDSDTLSTPETVVSTFVLTTDKSPTIANALASEIAVTGLTEIDLAGVFGGGSGDLTITASLGVATFTLGAGEKLALSSLSLPNATHSITFTATDFNGDAIEAIVALISDKYLVIDQPLIDMTVPGNEAIIDLTEAFRNDVEAFTLSASSGDLTDNTLILSDAVFTEGVHTITITATADDGEVTKQTFELVSDKSPTINTTIGDAHIDGNGGTTINLAGLFANGSGPLALTASHGVVGLDGSLTIADGDDLDNGANTITITATDDDITDKDSITSTFVITTDKSPTVNMGAEIGDASITGNDGTVIDISGVFSGGSGDLTLSASAGTIGDDKTLTLNGNDLVDGKNIIIIRATDDDTTDRDNTTDTFVITTNKSPTVANTVIDVNIDGNSGTTIDLSEVFGNGGGELNLTTASAGALGKDKHLTLYAHDLVDKTNSFTITAADTDTPISQTVITTFNIITTKTLDILDGAASNIYDATQHHTVTQPTQTFNLARVFGIPDGSTFSFTTASNGISLSGSTLTFDTTDTTLKTGKHLINVTAMNGTETVSRILTYTVDTIQSQTIDDGGNYTIYNGSTDPDMITGNSFDAGTNLLYGVHFYGGAGGDTIISNTLSSDDSVLFNNFEGGAGDDTISSNTITAEYFLRNITFEGGDGDDTISSNTFSSQEVYSITLDGGAGNDTISDNHFMSTGTENDHDVYRITLMGGAGDDLFRNNFATQSNGQNASLTIDGGDGEDTAVFRSGASEYTGITNWTGDTTYIVLTGDGAKVRLYDVETISFADGASYNAADAWVEGSGETLYDLTKKFEGKFANNSTTYSSYNATITGTTLTLAGTELTHGANTVVVTATANDSEGTETTETITVNALKTLKINGAKQHSEQTFDLGDIFVETSFTALNLPSGVTLDEGMLTFNNLVLGAEVHPITIAASDGDEALTLTLTYALDTIKNQTIDASNTTYSGTTLADTISNNLFYEPTDILTNVDLDGGAGNDTISDNHFQSDGNLVDRNVYDVSLNGGAGDDVFSNNTAYQTGDRADITIDGGEGTDKVYFALESSMFTVGGTSGSTITVTDNGLRAKDNGDAVDSYARYSLTDIEELYFNGVEYVFNGG